MKVTHPNLIPNNVYFVFLFYLVFLSNLRNWFIINDGAYF